MRVAVGSENPVKIAAARAVVQRLFGPDLVIIPVSVQSGVSPQPWGEAETRQGAVNRARAALAFADVDLGLGLEGGVIEVPNEKDVLELYTTAWCAIAGRSEPEKLGTAGGANLALPDAVADDLRKGLELGQAIDRLTGEHHTRLRGGAIGTLTHNWLDRQSAFEHVLTLAFARILSPEYY